MSRCHKCGRANLESTKGVFEYEQVSLPYKVMLVGVPIRRCPACKEQVVTIPDPEGLHRMLCLLIIEASRALHPQEIRLLRRCMDRSAEELSVLMGVDPKTLSRWENGRQKMGAVAERLLRLLVNQQIRPEAGSFSDRVFPGLSDEPGAPPPPVKLTSSRGRWKRAA